MIIDEFDALVPKAAGERDGGGNRRVVTEFQQQIDGIKSSPGTDPLLIVICNCESSAKF